MRYAIASNRDRAFSIIFSLVVGSLFALGFISTSQKLFVFFSTWIPKAGSPWNELKEMSFFPLLAALFSISLPKRQSEVRRSPNQQLFLMSILPLLIAFAFGKIIGNHLRWDLEDHIVDTIWYLVFIPFGEECLFRSWLYGVLDRIWPGVMFTATNPLPVAVWGSALAFSAWHIQNFSSDSYGLVFFQLGYTVITGLWLGVLRWKTGQLWPSVFAHALINFAAGS